LEVSAISPSFFKQVRNVARNEYSDDPTAAKSGRHCGEKHVKSKHPVFDSLRNKKLDFEEEPLRNLDLIQRDNCCGVFVIFVGYEIP
jgi:hypothetical protein